MERLPLRSNAVSHARRLAGAAAVLVCSFTACVIHAPKWAEKEIGELPVLGPGDHTLVVAVDGSRQVKFTGNVKMTFDDLSSAQYTIDLLQDGLVVGHTTCDPIKVRMCMVHVTGSSTYIGYCSMECAVWVPKSGPTTVRATFGAVGQNVAVERAILIIEQ